MAGIRRGVVVALLLLLLASPASQAAGLAEDQPCNAGSHKQVWQVTSIRNTSYAPTRHSTWVQAHLPLGQYVNASGFRKQMQAAMGGLTRQQVDDLAFGLYYDLHATWNYMAGVHSCCNRREGHLLQFGADEYSKYVAACDRNLVLQGRVLALAQAHEGPSNISCSPEFLSDELQYQEVMATGMGLLRHSMAALHQGWDVVTLLTLLKQVHYAELRDESYLALTSHLTSSKFAFHTAPLEWHARGIPMFVAHCEGGRQPLTTNVLHLVLRYSIACCVLEDFHLFHPITAGAFPLFRVNNEPGASDLQECSNISNWFDADLSLTELGGACRQASRAITHMLLDAAARDIQPVVENDISPEVDDSCDAPDVALDEDDFEECTDWVDCTQQFVLWLWLWVRHAAVPLLVVYLCWRPDLLVLWRPAPAVHAPSYKAYRRQLAQQQSAAKAARLAVTDGPRSSGSGGGSTSPAGSDPTCTPVGSSRRNFKSSGGSSRHSTDSDDSSRSSRSSPAVASAAAQASQPARRVSSSGGLAAGYVLHLLTHCWLPRVHFVAAAFALLPLRVLRLPAVLLVAVWRAAVCCMQLPLYVLRLSARLVLAVWHMSRGVAAAAAHAARAMVV